MFAVISLCTQRSISVCFEFRGNGAGTFPQPLQAVYLVFVTIKSNNFFMCNHFLGLAHNVFSDIDEHQLISGETSVTCHLSTKRQSYTKKGNHGTDCPIRMHDKTRPTWTETALYKQGHRKELTQLQNMSQWVTTLWLHMPFLG